MRLVMCLLAAERAESSGGRAPAEVLQSGGQLHH